MCVGARVAIKNMNHLPKIGLFNGAIGTVINIAYMDSIVGPTNKQLCKTPEYVVVGMPHLYLPAHIMQ